MTTNQNQPNGSQNQTPVVQTEKNVTESVLQKIKVFEETGTLNVPKNYSPANALRVAWLILQETKTMDKRPVLEVCSKESVANALLKMIILGLNPVKRQCSFIAYGSQLQCQREYQGTIAIAKRHGIVDVTGCAVFKDDVFEFVVLEDGTHKVTKHLQTIESIDTGVVKAAYATKTYEDGRKVTKVMSMTQIRKAWMQGQTKGESPAHKNFPDEMAIKSVINRLLKPDVNSSDDADLFGEDDDNGEGGKDQIKALVDHNIQQGANKIEASMDVKKDDKIIAPPAEEQTDEQTDAPVIVKEEAPY